MSLQTGVRRPPQSGFTLLEAVVVIFIIAVLAGVVITATGGVAERAPRDTTVASMTELRNVIVSRYYTDVGDVPQSLADILRCRDNATFGLPPTISNLSATPSPAVTLGWRGPYVLNSGASYMRDDVRKFLKEYGPSMGAAPPSQPTILDGWGNPIVIQIPNSILDPIPFETGKYFLHGPETSPGVHSPLDVRHARLVSAGPDGIIQTPKDDADAVGQPYPTSIPAQFPNRILCGDDIVLYLRVTDQRFGGGP